LGGRNGVFHLRRDPRDLPHASVASFEAAPPGDPSRREFSRLHGISMAVNLAILLEGVALIVAQEAFRR